MLEHCEEGTVNLHILVHLTFCLYFTMAIAAFPLNLILKLEKTKVNVTLNFLQENLFFLSKAKYLNALKINYLKNNIYYDNHLLPFFMMISSLPWLIIFCVDISQVSDLEILVNISYFQLYNTHSLDMILYKCFDCSPPQDVRGIFLVLSLKLLLEYDMMDMSTKYNVLE